MLDEKLKALASLRAWADERKAVAQQMRQRFYEEYVQRYDDELANIAEELAELEADIKNAARKAALETGDFYLSPFIEIKRKPATWDYDDATMLEAVQRECVAELVRTTVTLNKVELNKALRDGLYPWLPATPAPADVTVSIRPLGELELKGNG